MPLWFIFECASMHRFIPIHSIHKPSITSETVEKIKEYRCDATKKNRCRTGKILLQRIESPMKEQLH